MKHLVLAIVVTVCTVASAYAGPADMFPEKVMDFGTSPKGTVLVHYFRFTNTTQQTLNLGTPRVSCGCTSATVSKSQVAPGETAAVVAYMDTRRIPTPNVTKSVLVYVPFLSPTQEEVTLRVQTVARDDLLMSPDSIAFGNVKTGQGGQMSTKVTFMSDSNWKVTGASSTGGFVKAEFKEEGRNGSMVTYEVTAILDKACPAGNWVSDIHLTTSNAAVAKLRIPVTVAVAPAVAVTPESATFGNLPMGVEMEKKITLKSGKPFKILEVKGADEQLKVTVEKTGASEVHTIVVAANPKAIGGFTRMVEIVTDDKDQPKLIIPVTAKVVNK
ncbi:MAG: hypothetical protein C0467_05340 [Planctomycetaceae bacterium]|nr:hypothetical protein [Planctomycetaceae bacterium]